MLLLPCVPIGTGFCGTRRSTRLSSRPNESATFKSASTARSASSSDKPRLSACSYSSSRCCTSSSAISASRAGESPRSIRRILISLRKSGILDPGDPADSFDEFAPAITLRGENFFAGRCESIITAAALSLVLHPAAATPTTFLKSIQAWIKRGDIEAKRAACTQLAQLADVVTVTRPIFDLRKDQHFRASFLELT